MQCGIIKKYLKEIECNTGVVPAEIQKHLDECAECGKYFRFVSIFSSQAGTEEKAPTEMLHAIEKKIFARIEKQSTNVFNGWNFFGVPLKPVFAGVVILIIAIFSYTNLAGRNVGHVENLVERFKIAQFENVNAGDVVYTAENTTATIRLKNNNRLQIHGNTIVTVKSTGRIRISHGALTVIAGDKVLHIKTPNGSARIMNAEATIQSNSGLENDVIKHQTSFLVSKGSILLKNAEKQILLSQGHKGILSESNSIGTYVLANDKETGPENNGGAGKKIFAALEYSCDCLHACYQQGIKTDHIQFFGKEKKENKFKVRVFWQEKGLNELVSGPVNTNNKDIF